MISLIENSRHWSRPKSLERFTSVSGDLPLAAARQETGSLPTVFLCHRGLEGRAAATGKSDLGYNL